MGQKPSNRSTNNLTVLIVTNSSVIDKIQNSFVIKGSGT